jgi:succinyl-CoA synthetase beta subunit
MARLANHARPPTPGQTQHVPAIPHFEAERLLRTTDERSARALLRDCGIPVAMDELAQSREEAVQIAQRICGKVVLKVASAEIAHKSEVGGVLLGLEGAAAVGDGFDRLLTHVRQLKPEAHIDGVLVSPLIEGGVEVLVGYSCDPVFGPLVAVGLGGIFVETLKDKSVELAPFGTDVALRMLQSLRGFDILLGVRGRPAVDLSALTEVIARVSAFAARHADVVESLEINPLIVQATGVMAVDALLVLKQV